MEKIMRGKNLVLAADIIYSELIIQSPISSLKNDELTEIECKARINQSGQLAALTCEYYLKALLLPYFNIEDEGLSEEEEIDIIINRSQGLKRYSHFFKKFFDDNSQIPEEVKQNIFLYLSNNLNDNEIKELRKKLNMEYFKQITDGQISGELAQSLSNIKLQVFYEIGDSNNSYNETLRKLKSKIKEKIENNSNSYPESRYGALSDYEADIEFLYGFAEVLRKNITEVYTDAVNIKSMNRYIFPSPNTEITTIKGEQTEHYYLTEPYSTTPNPLETYQHLYCYEESSIRLNKDIDGDIVYYTNDMEEVQCISKTNNQFLTKKLIKSN